MRPTLLRIAITVATTGSLVFARVPPRWRVAWAKWLARRVRLLYTLTEETGQDLVMAPVRAGLGCVMGEVKRGADLACGTARATEEAVSSRPGLVMWGLERSRRLVDRASRRAHPRMAVARADTGLLPVATGSLDLVICQNAPVPFPEVARVLRPGGWAILTSVVSYAFPCVLLVRLRCRAVGLEARTVLTTDLGWAVVARRPGAAPAAVEAVVEEVSRVAHAETVG